jgi:hypothetical protein
MASLLKGQLLQKTAAGGTTSVDAAAALAGAEHVAIYFSAHVSSRLSTETTEATRLWPPFSPPFLAHVYEEGYAGARAGAPARFLAVSS